MQQLNDCASCKNLSGVIEKLHAKFVIYKKKNQLNDEFISEFKKQSILLQKQHILMQPLKDELQEKKTSLDESLNKIKHSEIECAALRCMLEKEKEDCKKEITARLKDSDLELQSLRINLDRVNTELEALKKTNNQLTEKLSVESTNITDLQSSHKLEKKQLQEKITRAENSISNFNRNIKNWSNMKDNPEELLKSVLAVVKIRERRNEAALLEANLLNSNDASDEDDSLAGPDTSPFNTPKKSKAKGSLATTDSSDDDFEEVSSNKTASPVKSLSNSFSNGIEMDLLNGSPSKRSPKKSPGKASPRKPSCKTSPKKAVVQRSSPRKVSPKKIATSLESAADRETTAVRRIELVSTGCDPMGSENEAGERTENIYLASLQKEYLLLTQLRSQSPFLDTRLPDLETTITPTCDVPSANTSVLCKVCDILVSRCTPCRPVLQELSKRTAEAEPSPRVEEERSLFSPPPPQEEDSSMSRENSIVTHSSATQTIVTSLRRRDVGTEPRRKITRTIGFQCETETEAVCTQTEPEPPLEESKCTLCDNKGAVCPMKEFLRTSLLNIVEQSKLVSAPSMKQFLETSLLTLIKQSDFIANCSGAYSGYQTLRPVNAFCVPYPELIPGSGTPPMLSVFPHYAYHLEDVARRMRNTAFPTFKKEETSRPNSDEEEESRRPRSRKSRSNVRMRSGSVICEPLEIECGDTSVEEIEVREGGKKRRVTKSKSLSNPSKKMKECTDSDVRSRTRTENSDSPIEFRYGRAQRLSESSEEEQETPKVATSTPKHSHPKDPPPTQCSSNVLPIPKDFVRQEASTRGRRERCITRRLPSVDNNGVLPRQVDKTSGVPAELPSPLPSVIDNGSVLPAQEGDTLQEMPAVSTDLPPRLLPTNDNGVLPRQVGETHGAPAELPPRLPCMSDNSVLPRQEDKTRGGPAELSPRSLPLNDKSVLPRQEDKIRAVPAHLSPRVPSMNDNSKVLHEEDKTRQGILALDGKRTLSSIQEKKTLNMVPAPADKVNAQLSETKLHAAKTAISFVSGGSVKLASVLSESSTKPPGGKIRKAHSRKVEVPASPDASKRYDTRSRGRSASVSPAAKSKKPSKPSTPDSRVVESQLLERVEETTLPPKSIQHGVNEKSKRKLIQQETSKKKELVQPKTSKKELNQLETSRLKELIQSETSKKEELIQPETSKKELMQPETSTKELIQPGVSKQKEPIQPETSKKELIQLETSKEISILPEASKEEDIPCVDVRRGLEDDLCLSDDSEEGMEAKSDKVSASIFDDPGEVVPEPAANIQERKQGGSPVAEAQTKELASEVEPMDVLKQQETDSVSVEVAKEGESLEHGDDVFETSGQDVSVIKTSQEELIGLFQDKNKERSEEASVKARGTEEDPVERGDETAEKEDVNVQQETAVSAVQENSASVDFSEDAEMETVDRVLLDSSLGNGTIDLENQEIPEGLSNAGKTFEEAIGSGDAEPVSANAVLPQSVPQQKRRISSSETEEVEEKRQKREVSDSQTNCAVQAGSDESSESAVADGSSLISPLVESGNLQGAQNSEGANYLGRAEISTALVFPDVKVSAEDLDQNDVENSMALLFGLLSDDEDSVPAENHESVPTPKKTETVSEVNESPGLFDDLEDTVNGVSEAVAAEKDVESLLVQSDSDLSTGVFGSLFDDLPEAASLSTVVEAVLPDLSDDLINADTGTSRMVLEDEVQDPAEKMGSEQETAAGSPDRVAQGEIPSAPEAQIEKMVVSNSDISPKMLIENEVRDPTEKIDSTAADSTKMVVDEISPLPGAPTEIVVVSDCEQRTTALSPKMVIESEVRDQTEKIGSTAAESTKMVVDEISPLPEAPIEKMVVSNSDISPKMLIENEVRDPTEKIGSTAAESTKMVVDEISPLPEAPAEKMVVSDLEQRTTAISPKMVIESEVRDPTGGMGSEQEIAAESTKMVIDEIPSLPEAPTEKMVVSNSKQGTAAHPSKMEMEDEAPVPPEDLAKKIASNSEQRATVNTATPVTPKRRLPVAAVPSGPYLTRRSSQALRRQTRPVTRKSVEPLEMQETEGRQLRSRGPLKTPEPKKMKFTSQEFISSDDTSESESERLVIDDSTSGRSAPQIDASSDISSPLGDAPIGSPDLEAERTRSPRKSSSSGRSTPVDKSFSVENAEAEKTTGTKGRRSASGKSPPLDNSTVENAEAEKTVGTRKGRKSTPVSEKKYNLRQSASSRASDSEVELVELPQQNRKRRSPRNLSKVQSTDDEVESPSDAEVGTAEPTKTGVFSSPKRASKLDKLRRNLSKAHPLMQKPSGRSAPPVKNDSPPKKGKSDKIEESQHSVATSMQMAKSGRTVCLITDDPKNLRRPKLTDQPKVTQQEVKIPTRISAKPRITPQDRIAALQARSNDIQRNATNELSTLQSSTRVPEACPPPILVKTPSSVLPKPRVTPQEGRAALDAKTELQPALRIAPTVKLEERIFKRSNSIRKMPAGRVKATPSPVVRLTPNLPPFAAKPSIAKPIAGNDDVFGVEAVIPDRPDFSALPLPVSPAAVPSAEVPSSVDFGKERKIEKDSSLKMTTVTSTSSAGFSQPTTSSSRIVSSSDSPGASGTISSLNPAVPLSRGSNIWVEPAMSMDKSMEDASPEPHRNQWRKKEPLGPITPVENVQPVDGQDLVALINATSPELTHFTGPVESDSHPLVLAWKRRGDRLRAFSQLRADMTRQGMSVPAIQKIFNAYLSSSNFDEDLLTNTVNTLLNPKLSFVDSIVARLAVDCVETDHDSEPCKDSSGPVMTKIQQQLIALIMRLFPIYRSIVREVLLLIEHRMFCLGQNTEYGRLPWLAVFHTSLCRIMKWRHLALIFCYDAMYSFVSRYATVLSTVFHVWPQLLPDTIDVKSASGLFQVMFHFVMTQGELLKQKDLKDIRDMLIKKSVRSGDTNSEQLMEKIASRLKEGKSGLICPEMILVSKRQGVPWAQEHIVVKYLLPMLRDWINHKTPLPPAAVLTLCGIVRVFNGQESSVETTHSLMKTLLQSAADLPDLEHVAAAGHVFLARHNIDYIVQILKEWKPKNKCPEWLIRILVGLIFGTARKTDYWTEQMKDLLQQSKKSLLKQIEALPCVETPSNSLESMRIADSQSSK